MFYCEGIIVMFVMHLVVKKIEIVDMLIGIENNSPSRWIKCQNKY